MLGVIFVLSLGWPLGLPVPLRSVIVVKTDKAQYSVGEVVRVNCSLVNSYPFPVRCPVFTRIEKYASISGESVSGGVGETMFISWASDTFYLRAHEEYFYLSKQMVFLAKKPGVVRVHIVMDGPNGGLNYSKKVAVIIDG